MRVSLPDRLALAGATIALLGLLVLLTPLHLAGAILLSGGVAFLALARPNWALWLILGLFLVHPLATKILQVNFGVEGAALLIASAWKEVALGCVLIARIVEVGVNRRAGQDAKLKLDLMDVMAAVFVVLVAVGFAERHDSPALSQARLLLFPIGLYLAVRLGAVSGPSYSRLLLVLSIGLGLFGIVQSSFFGFGFVKSYWGTADMPIPWTFIAQYLVGPRAAATLAAPNELGFALLGFGAMATAMLVMRPGRNLLAACALGVTIVAIALTFSRAAMAGFALMMVVILLAAWKYTPNRRALLGVLGVVIIPAALLSGSIYTLRGGSDLLRSTIQTLTSSSTTADTGEDPYAIDPETGIGNDPSTHDHLESLKAGWTVIESNPAGLGLGTVGSRADPLTSEKPKYIFESWFLTMGVSLGWAGLAWSALLPISMFLTALRAIRRRVSDLAIALLGFSVSIALVSYLLPTMAEPQLAMLPWVLAALVVGDRAGSTRATESA
jgi:hypothetical protein